MSRTSVCKILQWTLAGVGLWSIAVYLYVSLARMRFPYQLEWVEGDIANHVIRVLHGQPIYARPNIDFIAQIYPPLYFYLSAFLMNFTGVSFLPLRLVSWLASLGFLSVIFLWVRKETGRTEFALAAASLMAACYKITGSWYDVARVDSLFLFFALVTAYTVRFANDRRSWISAGILVFITYFTKQTATALFFPVFVYVFFTDRRQALWMFGTAAALSVGTTLWLDRASGGWYSYYTVDFAKYLSTSYTWDRFIRYWTKDLFGALPWACLVAAVYLILLRERERRSTRLFYAALLTGAALTSCVSRMHWGGAVNTLMPVYACLSILFGVAAAEMTGRLRAEGRFWLEQGVRAICVFQLASLFYTPGLRIPKKADWESGESLLRAMQSVKGEVYAPRFGYLPVLAGKRAYAHRSMVDLIIYYDPVNGPHLLDEIGDAIRHKRFAAIIFESDIFRWMIEENYQKAEPIEIKDSKFWAQDNARFVYVPKKHL